MIPPVRIVILAALAAIAFAAATPPGASRESAPAPGSLTNLRVCPYEGYSAFLKRCTSDWRTSTLTSNRFVCSVSIRVRRPPVRVRARMLYAGQQQFTFTSAPLRRAGFYTWPVWTNGLINQPLPAGPWSCTFSLGRQRAAAAFRSGGPTGATVDRAVCLRERAVAGGGLVLCPKDESGAPLEPGKPIVCTGMYNRQRGRWARISLNLPTGEELRSGVRTLIAAPFWVQYQTFTAQPEGEYTCRYHADDEVVGEARFRVGAQ
jgi:hypothetical protein